MHSEKMAEQKTYYIYGIFRGLVCLYVGRTRNPGLRLKQHLRKPEFNKATDTLTIFDVAAGAAASSHLEHRWINKMKKNHPGLKNVYLLPRRPSALGSQFTSALAEHSAKDLAKVLKVPLRTIYSWQKGERTPHAVMQQYVLAQVKRGHLSKKSACKNGMPAAR